ncbi:SgcJ/EcaC family oxidoreductase [Streptomyces sp. NRRL F-5123]|uniref:SgcJ/EcaC family oxidoreductase n=1 Tax=Streptomyces sp. NRRL F-5123 TaxID=1463856 RepID=UPI000693B9FD|nr:SgcJ/EcaC family oxidoreductase [Streptomyces sp. NRRL F-5123]
MSSSTTHTADTYGTADDTAIRDVFRAAAHAWAAGDGAAFAASYAPAATVVLPGTRLAGRAQIEAAMTAAFTGTLHGTRRVHEVRDVRAVTADVALVHTASATLAPGQDESAPEQRELVTWVLARHAGAWLIEAYHSSPALL